MFSGYNIHVGNENTTEETKKYWLGLSEIIALIGQDNERETEKTLDCFTMSEQRHKIKNVILTFLKMRFFNEEKIYF